MINKTEEQIVYYDWEVKVFQALTGAMIFLILLYTISNWLQYDIKLISTLWLTMI